MTTSTPKHRRRTPWIIGGIVLVGVGMVVVGNWESIKIHYWVGHLRNCGIENDREYEKVVIGKLRLFGARAVPPLIVGVKDKDAGVRIMSAHALEEIGPQASAAVPALVHALSDEHAGMYRSAATALIRIGGYPKEVEPRIREIMKEMSPVDYEVSK